MSDRGLRSTPPGSLHRFRVTGVEYHSHSTIVRPHEEEFEIAAESVGDALNELVNRSGMWETLDSEQPFTIEVTPGETDDD